MKLSLSKISDGRLYIALAVLALAVRLPLLAIHDFVTFDGTYYLSQALALLRFEASGSFPVGYPLAVAPVALIVRDAVFAGQLVSTVAAIASTLLLYRLARRFVSRELALLAAVTWTLNPVFLRYSVSTMSESLYIALVLLGLVLYGRDRLAASGAALGAAAITRPEALAIAGGLGLLRLRRPRKVLMMALAFTVVYAFNVAVLSRSLDRLVLLPKAGNFAASARGASPLETQELLEFEGRDEVIEQAHSRGRHPVSNYLSRLPSELQILMRSLLPVVVLLALYGMTAYPSYLLLALLPMLVYPAVTPRGDARFLLPYFPILILYAVMTIDRMRNRRYRELALAAMVLTIIIAPCVNKDILIGAEGSEYRGAQTAAAAVKDRIGQGDVIADRKPYFAFYAGGIYTPLPVAPYDESIQHLADEDVRWLSLNLSVPRFRKALEPLLFDAETVLGEMRYRQVHYQASGEMIYEKIRDRDPLDWVEVANPQGLNFAPTWSPDGRHIAFRNVNAAEENGYLYMVNTVGDSLRLIRETELSEDQLSWTADGQAVVVAFGERGERDIFAVSIHDASLRALVENPGDDVSPSVAYATNEMVFISDRSGANELWMIDLNTKELTQLTEGGDGRWPAFSANGRYISWIDRAQQVNIIDRSLRESGVVPSPHNAMFAASWSASGMLAVQADDWGSADVYLADPGAGVTLLMTKNTGQDGMPAWHPNRNLLAVTSRRDGRARIWIVTGIEPYLERLAEVPDFVVFEP